MTKIILVLLVVLILNEHNAYSSRHRRRYNSKTHCKNNGRECDYHSQCCSKFCHWTLKTCSIRSTRRVRKRQFTYPPGCSTMECEKDSDCCEHMSCQNYKGRTRCRWNLNPPHPPPRRLRSYSNNPSDELPPGCSFKECESDSDCCVHFWCQNYYGQHSCQWIHYPRFDSEY